MGCGSDGGVVVLSSQSCQLLEGRCGRGPSLPGACPGWIGDFNVGETASLLEVLCKTTIMYC